MWTSFLPVIIALWLWRFGVRAGGAGASHNACLHIDSLSFDNVIIILTVWNVMFSLLSVLQGCVFILPFYYTTLILSCCEILF